MLKTPRNPSCPPEPAIEMNTSPGGSIARMAIAKSDLSKDIIVEEILHLKEPINTTVDNRVGNGPTN
jgi:hypothetical protein